MSFPAASAFGISDAPVGPTGIDPASLIKLGQNFASGLIQLNTGGTAGGVPTTAVTAPVAPVTTPVESGMSMGAKVGIGVGIAAALLAYHHFYKD